MPSWLASSIGAKLASGFLAFRYCPSMVCQSSRFLVTNLTLLDTAHAIFGRDLSASQFKVPATAARFMTPSSVTASVWNSWEKIWVGHTNPRLLLETQKLIFLCDTIMVLVEPTLYPYTKNWRVRQKRSKVLAKAEGLKCTLGSCKSGGVPYSDKLFHFIPKLS
eukprot:6491958-Amphidinium_carterae.8